MREPTLAELEALRAATGARGVIVLAFDEDGFVDASTADTSANRSTLAAACKRLAKAIAKGLVPIDALDGD